MNITLPISEAQDILRNVFRDLYSQGTLTVQIVPDELPNVVEPPDIAPGHNPDGLTVEQVGIADGWRLLSKDEVPEETMCLSLPDTQWWRGGEWSATNTWSTCHDEGTLRTKNPPGHYVQYAKKGATP